MKLILFHVKSDIEGTQCFFWQCFVENVNGISTLKGTWGQRSHVKNPLHIKNRLYKTVTFHKDSLFFDV